jgi:hypothetical protein
MTELWTSEDEAVFRFLYRKYQRIHARMKRDKGRVKNYYPRLTQRKVEKAEKNEY